MVFKNSITQYKQKGLEPSQVEAALIKNHSVSSKAVEWHATPTLAAANSQRKGGPTRCRVQTLGQS